MNEPRYQIWRPIQPVKGQPIPEGAQYKTSHQEHWSPRVGAGEVFGAGCHRYEWRVPVEVVPIDLVADFIVENRTVDHYKRLWALNICAKTPEELRELVITKVRELSGDSK